MLRADTLAEVAAVPRGATSAIVTTLTPGVSVSFVVEAIFGAASARSAPSGAVRAFTSPAAPGGVTLTLVSEKLTELTINTRWAAASDNGSPIIGYAVTISTDRGFQKTTQVGGLSTGSVVTCGTRCDGIRVDASVQAINAAGNGQSGAGTYTYAAPPVPVITTFVCARIDGGNMRCDVDFAGTATIRWALNGSPAGGPGDVKNITFACGDSNFIGVDVIVSNVSGSDTESGACQPTQS